MHCVFYIRSHTGCPEKARRLLNNGTKTYCLIYKISFILNKAQPEPNLDFGTKINEIQLKTTEIHSFKVEH